MDSDSLRVQALKGQAARQRRRSIVVPAILIGLGLLLLAQNFGLVSADIWFSIWRLWPVALILVGLEVIFGRSSWVAAVGVVALLLLVGALITVYSVVDRTGGWPFGSWYFGNRSIEIGAPARVEHVVEDLRDARRATIDLRHGAGQLDVVGLPGDSSQLIEADLAHGENSRVDRSIDRRGDTVQVNLRGRSDGPLSFLGDQIDHDWTVKLSPKIPTALNINSGASQIDLDLKDLKISRLDVDAGASEVKITMPQAAGQTDARIKAGAAQIDVVIPDGVAARIQVRGGLSDATVDQSRFPKVGSYYQSPDYDSSANRIDLDIETGVSGLTIQ